METLYSALSPDTRITIRLALRAKIIEAKAAASRPTNEPDDTDYWTNVVLEHVRAYEEFTSTPFE